MSSDLAAPSWDMLLIMREQLPKLKESTPSSAGR